jgi:hypothetical protein
MLYLDGIGLFTERSLKKPLERFCMESCRLPLVIKPKNPKWFYLEPVLAKSIQRGPKVTSLAALLL